jgi:hypothetical protein
MQYRFQWHDRSGMEAGNEEVESVKFQSVATGVLKALQRLKKPPILN